MRRERLDRGMSSTSTILAGSGSHRDLRPVLVSRLETRPMTALMFYMHHQDEFTGINPNRQVPMLENGDFRLTETVR
jgi:hypothetical protein